MRGDHFDDLVLLELLPCVEVSGHREMAGFAVATAQGLVRDSLDEVLEEAVLAPLGRVRVGLDLEELLPHERPERLLQVGGRDARDGRDRRGGERLAEHRRILEDAALAGGEGIEARSDECVQRLGDLERRDRPRRSVPVAVPDEKAAVEQHPDSLDGVQRDALGAIEDPLHELLAEPRDEPRHQVVHRRRWERLEVQRGERSLPGTPLRPTVGQLRASERHHEDAVGPRPLEQVLEEVEEARIRPLDVFEDHHDRVRVAQPLEKEPPGSEHVLRLPRLALLQTEEMGQPRLDPALLGGIGDVLGNALAQLAAGRLGIVGLGDPRAHADHLGERPIRDTLAVREAAAAMPAHRLRQAVHVLLELPRESRLADPGDSDDRDEMGLALLRRCMEELLHQAELPLPAHEGRIEPGRPQGAAAAGGDADGAPELERLGLALHRVRTGILEDDGRFGGPAGGVADQYAAGRGERLDARRRVHEVAGHHALAAGADGHRRFAGHHPGAGLDGRSGGIDLEAADR
jgi:hypothetical protein